MNKGTLTLLVIVAGYVLYLATRPVKTSMSAPVPVSPGASGVNITLTPTTINTSGNPLLTQPPGSVSTASPTAGPMRDTLNQIVPETPPQDIDVVIQPMGQVFA